MDKKQLRSLLQNRLRELSEQDRAEKSRRACAALVATPEFQEAAVVMTYLALPHEVDTAPAILHAWQQGKTVVVPKISWVQRHMIPVEINTLETGLSTDKLGLKNPVTGVPIPLEEINLVVTPGLAFDRQGNRLGRGGAYFDRFFSNPELKAVKCGLAFSQQLVRTVPMAEHDRCIDMLVTEDEVLYFNLMAEEKRDGQTRL